MAAGLEGELQRPLCFCASLSATGAGAVRADASFDDFVGGEPCAGAGVKLPERRADAPAFAGLPAVVFLDGADAVPGRRAAALLAPWVRGLSPPRARRPGDGCRSACPFFWPSGTTVSRVSFGMVGEITTVVSPSRTSTDVPAGRPQAFTTVSSICSGVEPGNHTTGLPLPPSKETKILLRGTETLNAAPSKSWPICSTCETDPSRNSCSC
mmetsp:Transcript_29608/g.69805  ORF Transcript_29608/g.69805 Transcript_29608/m.69805 type:complete len:211 (-) Transcript_29608:125-757(-)